MSDVKLGTTPDPSDKRDAIHVAVIPMVADEILAPGQRVRIVRWGIAAAATADDAVGIVDPFLTKYVPSGESFWLCLLPGTVTGMRHHWSHPQFSEPAVSVMSGGGSGYSPKKLTTKEESEQWLIEFCDNHDCPPWSIVRKAIEGMPLDDDDDSISCIYDYEYLVFCGYDAHGNIPAEFWMHVENVLGHIVNRKPSAFTCSC